MTAESPMAAARSLPEVVGAALGTQSEDTAVLRKAVLAAIEDPAALKDWLGSLDKEQVVVQSYWHKNGFAKLVLHAGADFRIRMHVWPAGTDRLGEFHPHGHRWNFASTVLCGGGLATEEYQESLDGKPYMRHRYVGGGIGGLRPCGEVRLQPVSARVVGQGEQHSVDISVIHTVHPVGDDVVATLVVQSRMLTEDTAVYCPLDEVIEESTDVINSAEVDELLNAVERAMGTGA